MAHFICQVHIKHWLLTLRKPERAIVWLVLEKRRQVVPAACRSAKMTGEMLVGGHKAGATMTHYQGYLHAF